MCVRGDLALGQHGRADDRQPTTRASGFPFTRPRPPMRGCSMRPKPRSGRAGEQRRTDDREIDRRRDDAVFDRQIAVNLKGTFNGMREAARRLRSGGPIVNFSTSVVGTKFELPASAPDKIGVGDPHRHPLEGAAVPLDNRQRRGPRDRRRRTCS
jgi:hypothetical protein